MIRTKDEVIKYLSSTLESLSSKKNKTLFKMVVEGIIACICTYLLFAYYKQNPTLDVLLALGIIISVGLVGYNYLVFDTYLSLIRRGDRLLKQLKITTVITTNMEYRIKQYFTNIRHYVDNQIDPRDVRLTSMG